MANWEDFDDDQYEDSDEFDTEMISFGSKPARVPLALTCLASFAGIFFAATSTADFIAHLDRQVHAVHCSVLPGGGAALGDSGCRAVMMSPYSSWFRDLYWGGIPISLFAVAVFSFIAYRSAYLLWRGRPHRNESIFLFVATLLPVVMSVIYGNIAARELGAMCTVCVGIYVVSGVLFASTLASVFMSETPEPAGGEGVVAHFAVGVLEGVAFVAVLTIAYIVGMPEVAPDNTAIKGAKGCGTLAQSEDPAKIMVPLAPRPGATPSIELLDPLCPACRAFDERLQASGLGETLDQRAVLFPLDSACNWMVQTALHPGACAVSEAMLCAPDEAPRILKWAFAEQEKLLAMGKDDEKGLRRLLKTTFPAAASCMGTAVARNKMVKSLRWAVANALPVMTPQLFVNGRRICDEDTDLGLEYTLTRMTGGQP